MENPNLEAKLTIAYEVIEHRLTAIWHAIDAIDTKTSIVFGFASTVLLILGGLFSLEPTDWTTPSVVLFCLALTSYIIVVILSVLSYRVVGWSYRPDPSTLIKHCRDTEHGLDDIREWVAHECQLSCEDSSKRLAKKSKLTNGVIYAFAVETLLLAVGFLYSLIVGLNP